MCRKENKLTNSLKVIIAFICILMVSSLLLTISGVQAVIKEGDQSMRDYISVDFGDAVLIDVEFKLNFDNYLLLIANACLLSANWGLAFLFLFTVNKIRFSLQWE